MPSKNHLTFKKKYLIEHVLWGTYVVKLHQKINSIRQDLLRTLLPNSDVWPSILQDFKIPYVLAPEFSIALLMNYSTSTVSSNTAKLLLKPSLLVLLAVHKGTV